MDAETTVGGDERRVLEVRARTVDEAIARGLVRLGGLSRNEVDIEVLGEGRPGLLGFGAEEAAVRLTVLRPGEKPRSATPADVAPPVPAPAPEARVAPAPAPAPASEPPPAPQPAPAAAARPTVSLPAVPADLGNAAAVASAVTLDMLRLMGFDEATVEPGDALLPSDMEEEESLVLSIRGRGVDRLLAYDGEALNALQFLVRLVVSRRLDGWMSVLLDVNGDRARRVQELLAMAGQSAELVQKEGRAVALPPMSAYERRVVHLVLRDHPTVATQSIGSGSHRKVTVRLKDQLLPEH